MSKEINCVIDTQNKEERTKLIDYVTRGNITISTVDDYDGFQLVAISEFGAGYIGVIVADNLVNKKDYKHFSSVDDYIEECESNK